jgi:hypothetical protein
VNPGRVATKPRNARSLIVVYAWQDDAHYNYAHMSSDEAAKQNVRNGMFHVFGGERVRISPLDGPASFTTRDWVPVKLVFDGESGRCYAPASLRLPRWPSGARVSRS